MPIKYSFPVDKNLVICVHEGVIEDEEFITSYKSLFENESFDTNMNLLVDLRQTDSSTRSNKGLNLISRYLKSKYQGINRTPKVAVLAPTDLSFGIARMFEGFSNDIPINYSVFRSVEDAQSWLETTDEVT